MTAEETAKQISELADDGLQATIDCFIAITSETIGQYADFNFISRKFHGLVEATSAATKQILALRYASPIEDLKIKAAAARNFIAMLYPSSVADERGAPIRNTGLMMLTRLINIAESYRKVALYAEQTIQDKSTLSTLLSEAYSLQAKYDSLTELPYFQDELKPLHERHHLTDILPKIEAMKREYATGETTILDIPTGVR